MVKSRIGSISRRSTRARPGAVTGGVGSGKGVRSADLTGAVPGSDAQHRAARPPGQAEIDTPERGQPYGSKSRQILADLAFQRDATIKIIDTGRGIPQKRQNVWT